MTTIDGSGMLRSRLDEVLANTIAAYQSVYGADVDVSPGSADGQWLGIISESIADLSALVEDVYLARSVSGARGASLSRLVRLIGISRNVASYSTADVVFSGVPGTTIPDASLIDTIDTPPSHYQTVGTVTVDASGTVPGQVRATTTGPVFGDAGKITDIKTVISGWTSVTNALPVNLGSDQETDAALRIRRAASVAITSQSIVDGLYAALANIQGVSDAAVFENKTGSPISRPGAADLPPNSIQVVVRGGLDADIAAAIWAKASAGVTLVGATSANIVDSQGNGQSMRWDRPIAMDVYYYVRLKQRYAGQAYSASLGTVIRNAIADWGAITSKVGTSVPVADLYGVVTSALAVLGDVPSVNQVWLGYTYVIAQEDLQVPFNKYPQWSRAYGTAETMGQSRVAVADFVTNISVQI